MYKAWEVQGGDLFGEKVVTLIASRGLHDRRAAFIRDGLIRMKVRAHLHSLGNKSHQVRATPWRGGHRGVHRSVHIDLPGSRSQGFPKEELHCIKCPL